MTAVLSLSSAYRKYGKLIWAILFVLFVVFIGLRHEVGGDWGGYLRRYNEVKFDSFLPYVTRFEVGYMLLNWVSYQLNGGIYLVNTVCAIIFVGGLISFCRTLPFPFLAFSAAIPYMIIVVSMGYTRQSAALGLIMFSMKYLSQGRTKYSVMYILLATLFHKSAIIILPLVILYKSTKLSSRLIGVGGVILFVVLLSLSERFDRLWHVYVITGSQSDGAVVRLIMNLIPAIILIVYYSRMRKIWGDSRLWLIIALINITLLPFAFGPMSTAVDRIALYFMPLQLVVFSRFPALFSNARVRIMLIVSTLLYYASVQFVWLNYSNFSAWWVPYQNYLTL